MKTHLKLMLIVLALTLLSGCIGGSRSLSSSSVVDYLYHDEKRVIEPTLPQLNLPVRVGVAFVPSPHTYQQGRVNQLTPQQQTELLNQVASRFKPLPFVGDVTIIPAAYLRPRGGFENLGQLKRMFNIEVIALVSHDQHQFTDPNLLSLTYWTLVGAYVVPGEKNATHTLLDTAIFDIDSRSMLFRAPGTSSVSGLSIPAYEEKITREHSYQGFQMATKDMINNLTTELEQFKKRVKEQPDSVNIRHRDGYTGGSIGLVSLLMLGLIAGLRRRC